MTDFEIDLTKVTVREYRLLFDKSHSQDDEDVIIAKAAGLSVEDMLNLPQPDYRRLIKAFFAKATEPLDDPN